MNGIANSPALTEIAIALNAFGIPAYNTLEGRIPLPQVSIGRGFSMSQEVIRGEAERANLTLRNINIPFGVRLRLPINEALSALSFQSADKVFQASNAKRNGAFRDLVSNACSRSRDNILASWQGDVHELTAYGAEVVRANERAFEKTKVLLTEFCHGGYCPADSGVKLKGRYGGNCSLLFSVEERATWTDTVASMMRTAEALGTFLKNKYWSEWV
jgi:hypothetical protein